MERRLHLNLFIYPGGHHEAAWRYRDSAARRILDLKYYVPLVQRAEAAKFDAVFLADGPSIAPNIRYVSRLRLEPFTWLSAFAAVTERIGLIGTASTTYNAPYNLARLFSSLDHLSAGRAGWNIVTTAQPDAAQNFGLKGHPVHADRYNAAHEFVDVVTRLWDSWEDTAFVADAESGLFADPGKIHAIHHDGELLQVRGPLDLPRSPQGRPVYVQAGASEHGRSFAARYAEVIFSAHQTLASAQEFYQDLKARAAGAGRDPAHVKILPGVSPYIASTDREAERLLEEFNELIQPEYSIDDLMGRTGVDLRAFDLDETMPRELLAPKGEAAATSRFKVLLDIIDRERPTIRQLLYRMAGARGHCVVTGSPERIADHIQLWFEQGAADGFNVMPPFLTGGFDLFIEHVAPILRKRGLWREEYSGPTLRDHLGLPRPSSAFA